MLHLYLADAVTISDVFTALTSVFKLLLEQLTSTVSTITGNPILFVPVLVGLGGGIILAGVKLVRKLGVRSKIR